MNIHVTGGLASVFIYVSVGASGKTEVPNVTEAPTRHVPPRNKNELADLPCEVSPLSGEAEDAPSAARPNVPYVC
jgi:hypothetical protein